VWVRSQDRTILANCIEFHAVEKEVRGVSQNSNSIGFLLGKYNSSERALEVIDELQEKLIEQQAINNSKSHYIRRYAVYEMPKRSR